MTYAEQRAVALHLERHAEVRAALLDTRLAIYKPLGKPDAPGQLDAPGERHPPARSHRIALLSRILAEHLSARSVAGVGARVNELAAALVDRGSRRGEMDLVADLAYPLTLAVMLELLGLPNSDHHELHPLFATITAGHDIGASERQRAAARFAQLSIMRWVSRHLAASSSPLAAALRANAGRTDLDQAAAYWCTMLLYAGSTTTRDFIANCLARLIENPGEAEMLRDSPALMNGAIDELLRVEGPVRALGRLACEQLTVGKLSIPRGAVVYLHLDKANRDPACFAAPDRVDFARSPNPHLAFGLGPTYCLGSHLARLETRTVLEMLLPRLALMKLVAKPEWGPSNVLRGRSQLAVRFR